MPPKTLTAEQVAEIDRQQKPAVNMRDVVPQREDVLAARITAQERREAAPATLTPEQADATEAQASVAAMTPFGRAMGAEPDRTTGPVFQPKKRLSAAEADQMQYEQISSPAYMPTKGEFQWYEGYRKTRDDKVSKFVQGATGMAGGLVQAAAATAYAPFDLLVRGTPAWNEWVNSSAEGLRQTSIGLAELWSWGGDIYEDNQKELQRSRDLNNQIRQQLAAENKFTGNAQQDDQILEQAIEQAKAGGLYEKTADDLNADEDTRFERFIRDRSFQQQSANIAETNIGTLPDSQREMGIDPSKVNPGLAFTAQLVFDPLNAVVPGGIGALSNLRLMRRTAALAGAPLKWSSQVAKASADKVEDLYGGILSGIESRTGLNEAAAMGALNNPVTWRAVAAMGILKGTGKVLRKSENWLETGSIIAKEAGVGGVGISRADAAARLRNAPIPERYRRAYDGFFTSADSTLRRVSETPGLSPIARRSAATLDRTGVTQAFRLADDAVSGAAAAAPIGIPFAAIAPEDRQPEILGALLSIGAAGGVVGGQARRMSQMNDALVAKMLADAEISGGDAVAMANMLSPEKLADMARKQTMISAKADWVPLRAVDYELNKTVQEAVGNGTKGIHVEATPGKRPRVFLNLDKLASGDVAGHEIGHAIFMSDIMGGEIKQGMRAMVDVEYGAEGLAARGREYAAAMLTQEVNQGATGIKLEVLTPEEVNRKAAGVSEADLIRDRWSNDSAWRDSAINDRIDLMNQERMARGGQPLDWARDEIAAETFSGLGKGVNLNGLRASGPLGRAVGAAQTALDMMGARFRGNGRLESPNKLFTENPLFDSPQMRKAVNDYVKIYDRYLVGLEKEGKVQQRGTPIAPTGRASDAARSPHTRLYPNKGVVESDLFVQRPDGTLELKSQQMINTQDKARAATLKSINSRDRLVPENSQEWGARRLSNGRVVVGGPTLPPQFDFFLQMPEWLRFKAREFEAGRNEGRSYLYSYNAIGTGADGSYKVKNLGNVEAKTGEAVPFGWDLSQKNHLLAKVIDLNSFRASSMRAIDNQLLGEFGNDLKAVEAGLKQLLKNYQDGVPGETNLGVTKKNILNGLLGTGTPTQRANNPAWHTLNNQGSIRTFRFDRLNYADPYGTGYFPHYDKLNINALPDNAGRMSLDEYMSFDADRQTAWLNNRARERGHSNSTNWQNSDEAGFAAAAEEYRQLFPRADAPMARGNAMPDTPANLSTDQILRELEENQGYLGLSTLGMREGRPVKGGAQQTRELLKRNTALNEELRRRGGPQEESDVERVLRQRGQAMPDVERPIKAAVVTIGDRMFTGTTHAQAFERAVYEGAVRSEGGKIVAPSGAAINADLFMTNNGKIIDRFEASKLYGSASAERAIERGTMQRRPAGSQPMRGQAMPDVDVQWETYAENLRDDVESWSPARDTGKIDYDMMDVVDSFMDFARTNPQMAGGELTAAFYRAEKPTASQRKKLNAAIANVGEPPRTATGGTRGQAMPDVAGQQTMVQRNPAGDYEPLGMLKKQKNGNWAVYTAPMMAANKDGTQTMLPPSKLAEYPTEAKARARAEKEFFTSLPLQGSKQYLGPREQKAVTEAQRRVAEVAKNNPEAARLEVTRDDRGLPKVGLIEDADGNPVLDARGNQKFGAIYRKAQYDLRKAPGLSKDEARAVQQAADLMEADARRGQANPAIAKGIGWYGRMRGWLQQAYGATIEMFGQLLGATSARTPVDTNFIQAREALQIFGRGGYDDLLGRFDAFVMQKKADADSGKMEADWRKRGGKGTFKLQDEYRKQVNSFKEVPLRANGKKYNANSTKVLHALYGNWIAQTKGPKTPNFAGNLTGRTFKATIDVWAARNLRRLLYQGKAKRWRILPEQEQGVADVDFFFGQKVYDEVGRRMGIPTDDLQALQWFNEKDIWETNDWTDKTGAEKSSFDKEAGKLNLDRYQVGLTTFQDAGNFDPAVQRAELAAFRNIVRAQDGLEAARVTESEGLYGNVIEPTFDAEFSVNRKGEVSPSIEPIIRQAIDTANRNRQNDVFISAVVDETHPNARPMVEVGFKSAASRAEVEAVTAVFRSAGIDGFTVARNERGDVLGIRAQYVPEISARYDALDHLDPDQFAVRADKWMDVARNAIASLENQDNVSYRKEGHVSTNVYGIEEYGSVTPADILRSSSRQELGRRRAILAAGTR
jgi:hypothetical protein